MNDLATVLRYYSSCRIANEGQNEAPKPSGYGAIANNLPFSRFDLVKVKVVYYFANV